MKRILVFAIIFFQFSFLVHSPSAKKTERIIPGKVDFRIGTLVDDNIRYAVLSFRCYAGSVDDWASDLRLKRVEVNDTSIISILGYDYINHTDSLKEHNLVMTIGTRFSRKTLPLSSQIASPKYSKYLIIMLDNKKNQFRVIHDNLKLTLVPQLIQNIHPDYSNKYFDPLEVLLAPNDIYVAYISGKVNYDIDYIPHLIEFCRNNGLFTAREKYPQFPLNRHNFELIVYSNETIKIEKGSGIYLGSLKRFNEVDVNLRNYKDYGS